MNLRPVLSLAALAGTFAALIATSPPPTLCATESRNLVAETSCGAPANLVVSTNGSCIVTATNAQFAGLPIGGSVSRSFADAGLAEGFTLSGAAEDGGAAQVCKATPAGGGFEIVCGPPSCSGGADAGCVTCSGTLAPP